VPDMKTESNQEIVLQLIT